MYRYTYGYYQKTDRTKLEDKEMEEMALLDQAEDLTRPRI